MKKEKRNYRFARPATAVASAVALCAAAVLAPSCKKSPGEAAVVEGVFRAYTEAEGGKTALNGASVTWSSGDVIKVFSDGGGSADYRATSGAGSNAADFEVVDGTVSGYSESGCHVAVYPASCASGASCADASAAAPEVTSVSLPKVQKYASNSFGRDAFPMFAKAGDGQTTLQFKNLCGALRLSLYDLPWEVTKITVESVSDEDLLWGDGDVTIGDGGVPTLGALSGGDKSVELDCTPGVRCNGGIHNPTHFYIVLPAGVFSTKGFNVKVECGSHYERTVSCSKSNEIVRSSVTEMTQRAFFAVDMGLASGTLWAPCNLGVGEIDGEKVEYDVNGVKASVSKLYGDYYAWAATSTLYTPANRPGYPGDDASTTIYGLPSGGYGWNGNMPYYGSGSTESDIKFKKYVTVNTYAYGNMDNIAVLEAGDDAAAVRWGGAWSVPDKDDFVELLSSCYSEWRENFGDDVNGLAVYKPLDDSDKGLYKLGSGAFKTIAADGTVGDGVSAVGDYNGVAPDLFIPAAGSCGGSSRNYATAIGDYWSRSLYSTTPCNAYLLYFSSDDINPASHYVRFDGFSVRPVL